MRIHPSALLLFVVAPLSAQLRPVTCCNKGPVIVYDIAFPNAAHHEAEVKATFTALPPGPVNIRMARSSTGRYALTEYAKNVYAVKAVNGAGKPLAVTHPDPYSWTVAGHDGTVTFSYTDYANVGNGTFSGYNPEQEHIQPQCSFVYVKGLEARPIRVTFHRLDPAWTIATQLVPTADPETFTAPGMQYLFDSPTHLGMIQWREWTETHDGVKQTWRVALDDPTGQGRPSTRTLTAPRRSCTRPARCTANSRSSTSAPTPSSRATDPIAGATAWSIATRRASRAAAWEVTGRAASAPCRTSISIRGTSSASGRVGLEPFDYDRANMTDGLWIAEGFTQYYGPLLEARAGVIPPRQRDPRPRAARSTTSPIRRAASSTGRSA